MPTLTVFSNFFINDKERFLRLKDSFNSFKDIKAEKWIINARGKYKLDVLFFLHDHLGDKLSAHLLESGKGWFHDSRKLILEIKTDYVMYWIEDQINMANVKKYDEILKEMELGKVDYLRTSWWLFGRLLKVYDIIQGQEFKNIKVYNIDKKANEIIQKHNKICIIDLVGIYSSALLKKNIQTNVPMLRRWPKETPFDFEKEGTDTRWLPIKTAVPKYELFASIDTDHGCPGYSLQSRGLYSKRIVRQTAKERLSQYPIYTRIIRKILPCGIIIFLKRLSYHF